MMHTIVTVNDELKEAYIRQAVEVDKKADNAVYPSTAAMWRRIAESYRVLAAEREASYSEWI